MKVEQYLQFGGKEVELKEIEKAIREEWKQSGRLVKDIKSLKIYLKPEEYTFYYVVNDEPVRSLTY